MKQNAGLINSPQSPARAIHSLRANALATLPGNENNEYQLPDDEVMSKRSNARSLSI